MDRAKEYAGPVLKALENNSYLFEQINDLVNYRNIAAHSRTPVFGSNSRQMLRIWHNQFMEVWSAVVKGYSE